MVYLKIEMIYVNLEYFIAKRVQSSTSYKNSVSAPIIKIAIAAIAIGIIVMLIAIATGVGLQRKIKEKVSSFNGHVSISLFDRNNSITTIKPISVNQDFYPDFTSVPQVEHIQSVATKGGIIRTATDFEGVIFKGVAADYNWDQFIDFVIEGEIPDVTQETTSKDILISDDIARRLNLKVGDKARTFFMKEDQRGSLARAFTVSGIYDSGLEEYDSKFIIGDLRNVRKINGWADDEIGKFEVFITDFNDIERVSREINKNVGASLYAASIKDQFPTIFQWLSLLDSNIYGIIGIILIVAIINMITALLVLILERTQMIGTLKALGANDWTVRRIFLYNAMNLVFQGMLIGNVIGLGLIAIQYYFSPLTLDPTSYYVTQLPVYISLGHVLLVNMGTFSVCLIALTVPTVIISGISPVKAMRFQ
jgi:lipoprotein-releasing system permease protein